MTMRCGDYMRPSCLSVRNEEDASCGVSARSHVELADRRHIQHATSSAAAAAGRHLHGNTGVHSEGLILGVQYSRSTIQYNTVE